MASKRSNKYKAQRAMWAGAVFTLLGLLIFPLHIPGMLLKYSSETGYIGDTIGGIAGPILNFTGLIIVYYSLREQFKANKQQAKQIRDEVARARNERYFDLTLKLTDKLSEETEKKEELFEKLPKASFEDSKGDTYAIAPNGKGYQSAYAEQLRKYWWGLFDLNEYFSMIISQLESNELTGQQKLVLINLVDITYGRRLKNSRVGYQQQYQNGFERNANAKDSPPEHLKHIDDRLVEIYQMQEKAKDQVKTENIQYGDANNF